IDRDPRQILRPKRPALVRHPQALGEEKFQLVAEALAPMAQVRALVRKLVLEELLSSEVLEIRVIDPALARTFVGQAVNMLEQKKPDHKPCRNSGPTTVAIQQCDLAVDKVPVDLTRELHQLVPHVDDLVQLRAEQITRSCRLVPHRSLRYGDRITLLDSRESRKRNCKLPAPQTLKPCNLKVTKTARKRLSLRGLEVLHGRLKRIKPTRVNSDSSFRSAGTRRQVYAACASLAACA